MYMGMKHLLCVLQINKCLISFGFQCCGIENSIKNLKISLARFGKVVISQ